jgi:general secretion pathway protein E
LYAPQGCEQCNFIGYRGRNGVHELVDIDSTLRSMIHDGAGQQALENYAHQYHPSIQQNGLQRVRNGDTALEELLRVTKE